MMLEAVIFDMDGVVVDTEEIYLQWFSDFLKARGYSVSRKVLNRSVGLSSDLSRKYMQKVIGEDGADIWNEYIKETEDYPIDYTTILNEGVRDVLECLKENQIPAALASSSSLEDIEEVLRSNRLYDYFQVITSGDMYRESKPNPEIYLHTAKLLRVNPKHCIVIEDSSYGIEAGKAAGAYVIAKRDDRFDFDQSRADRIVDSLTEVEDMIRQLF